MGMFFMIGSVAFKVFFSLQMKAGVLYEDVGTCHKVDSFPPLQSFLCAFISEVVLITFGSR